MEKRKSRKDSSVFIRFEPKEKETIRKIAESQGHTVSSYLRHIILTTLKEREEKMWLKTHFLKLLKRISLIKSW